MYYEYKILYFIWINPKLYILNETRDLIDHTVTACQFVVLNLLSKQIFDV